MVALYPNRGGECFFSSLANLLSFRFRDEELAEKVLQEWWKHEIVQSNGGTLHFSWPYLVSALTDRRYRGTLYANLSSLNDSYSSAEKHFPTLAKFYEGIIDEGMQTGRIVHLKGPYNHGLPVILSLTKPKRDVGHAVALLEGGIVIDDGKLEDFFDHDHAYEINGVLLVNPN